MFLGSERHGIALRLWWESSRAVQHKTDGFAVGLGIGKATRADGDSVDMLAVWLPV